MAIAWGAWSITGGNGMRVGLDVRRVEHTQSYVKYIIDVWTENQYQYSDNQRIDVSGFTVGAVNYNNTSAGGAVLRGNFEQSYFYGTSHSTYVEARVSGTYNGSAPTARVNFTVPAKPTGAPPTPTVVAASINAAQTRAVVSWQGNPPANAPWSSLKLEHRFFSGSSWKPWGTVANLPGTSRSYAHLGNFSGEAHEWRVTAINVAGARTGTTKTYFGKPNPPALPAARRSGNVVNVSWSNGAGYSPTPPHTVRVERSIDAGVTWTSMATGVTGSSWVDNAPPAVPDLRYRVAYNIPVGQEWTPGQSDWAVTTPIRTAITPLAPTNLVPTGFVDFSDPVTFSWKHNHAGDGSIQSKYEISYKKPADTTWKVLVTGTSAVEQHVYGTGVVGDEFTNGNTYNWRVRTQGASGANPVWSPYSAVATVTGSSPPVVAIVQPTDTLTAAPLVIVWEYSQPDGQLQNAWEVEVVDLANGGVVWSGQGNGDIPFAIASSYFPADGQQLRIRVRARSGAGFWSEWAEQLTTVSLPTPQEAKVNVEYVECTGTVALRFEDQGDPVAPSDFVNLVFNPSARKVTTTDSAVIHKNLVQHSGFETATPWNVYGKSGGYQDFFLSLEGSTSWIVLAQTSPVTGAPLIYQDGVVQTVTGLVAGSRYVASCWVRCLPGSEAAMPGVMVEGAVDWGTDSSGEPSQAFREFSTKASVANEWVRVSASFTATATSHKVIFGHSYQAEAGMSWNVDNAMVTLGDPLLEYFDSTTVTGDGLQYRAAGNASEAFGKLASRPVFAPVSGSATWRGGSAGDFYYGVKPAYGNTAKFAVSASNAIPFQGVGEQGEPGSRHVFASGFELTLRGSDEPISIVANLERSDGTVLVSRAALAIPNQVTPFDLTTPEVEIPNTETHLRFTLAEDPAKPTSTEGWWVEVRKVYVVPSNYFDATEPGYIGGYQYSTVPAYTGGYFDGASADAPTYTYAWSVPASPDDTRSRATGRAEVPIDKILLQRRVPGEDWVTLADDIVAPTTFVDVSPSTNGINEYRVISVSGIPTYRVSEIISVPVMDGKWGGDLWGYLSYGPGFGQVLRMRCSLDLSQTTTHERDAIPLMGRRWPLFVSGQNSDLSVSVSGNVRWFDRCHDGSLGSCTFDSPLVDWEDAALTDGVVLWRDHTGRRVFGELSDVSTSNSYPGMGSVSFSVRRVFYNETYGIELPQIPNI